MKKNLVDNSKCAIYFQQIIQVALILSSIAGIFACTPISGDTGKITIPEKDVTPPSITVSVNYDGISRTFSEKNNTIEISAKNKVKIAIRASDEDGGIRYLNYTILKSWVSIMSEKNIKDTVLIPELNISEYTVASKETESVGTKAPKSRIANFIIDLEKEINPKHAGVILEINASASNYHNGKSECPKLLLIKYTPK